MSGQPATRGTCLECRHANQGTMDAEDGFWACPWLGQTSPNSSCRIRYKGTDQFVFEPYDGTNCTWGSVDPTFRAVPKGYDDREVIEV